MREEFQFSEFPTDGDRIVFLRTVGRGRWNLFTELILFFIHLIGKLCFLLATTILRLI